MTSLDLCRRAVSVVLVAACLLLVPTGAMATFTGRRAAPLDVSTDTMEMPVNVVGTFACSSNKPAKTESVTINVTGFDDAGPAGSTYSYAVLLGGTSVVTGTSTTHARSLVATVTDDTAATTWTLTIHSTLGAWTGPAFTTSVACLKGSTNSGTL